MGDIIKVNGSDFVPADAVILSSRYMSLPDCGELLSLSSSCSISALPKEVMVR